MIPVRVKSSIGSRLFIAFVAMGAITAGLGAYSVYVLSSARVFVADTYDRALMEVNFGRTAALDFNRMDKELLRRAQAPEGDLPAIDRRLHAILAELDADGFDLLVLLCTGQFNRFNLRTPFIEPQHTVDHFVQGLAYGAERLGILLPNAAQIEEFHGIPGVAIKAAAASPYVAQPEAALRDAGAALADCDVIVMHCIGYSEAMRQVVKQASGRPVLVSRRLVAHAIDLLLS